MGDGKCGIRSGGGYKSYRIRCNYYLKAKLINKRYVS